MTASSLLVARRGLWRTVGALCLTLLFVASSLAGAKRAADPLQQVNERWAGAECRIRFEVPIKKGKDGDGWSKSIWIVPGTQIGKDLAGAKLFVSNRDRLPGGRIYPGTSFVAEGWAFDRPKDQDGLRLALRFADGSGKAYFSFRKGFGKVGAKYLETVERWARMEMFHVSAADETLEEIPVRTAGPAPALSPVESRRSPPPVLSPPAALGLKVMGVTVAPLQARPGSQVDLVVTYALEGGVAGQFSDVLERRVILRDGQVLTTLEATVARVPGTHKSIQTLGVPADLEAGIYELRASVEIDGRKGDGAAIFQVMAADG